jgi:hypothetical protein
MVQKDDTTKVIVVRPAVAVPNSADRLYNGTTKAFNQAVGSIGAYIDVAGSGNPAAMTPGSYAGEGFRFIQVRDKSADRSPLPNYTLVESAYIYPDTTCLEIAGEGYSAPENSSWVMGAPNAATTSKVPVSSNNLYTFNVS